MFYCMKIKVLLVLTTFIVTNSEEPDFSVESGYNRGFVSLVETVYGENYLSQGGKDSTLDMFVGVDLENKKLLSIGSGLGGPDFDLAKTYNVEIVGVDPEQWLVEEAKLRKIKLEKEFLGSVSFKWMENPLVFDLFEGSLFDILASKEVILHVPVESKLNYFKEMYRVLKSGGQIVVKDWIKRENFSKDTEKMMEDDGVDFNLIKQHEYLKYLEEAGFKNIIILDETDKYVRYCDQDLKTIVDKKEQLESIIDYDALEGWQAQKNSFENREIGFIKITANK